MTITDAPTEAPALQIKKHRITKDAVVYEGHVLDALRMLPDQLVQTVVTSPPYYGLRAYGTHPIVWPNPDGTPPCGSHDWSWDGRRPMTGGTGPASAKQVTNAGSQYGNQTNGHAHEWGDEIVKHLRGRHGEHAKVGNSIKEVAPRKAHQGQFCVRCVRCGGTIEQADQPCPAAEHEWGEYRLYVEGGGTAQSSAEAFSVPGAANADRIRKARWRTGANCIQCGAWKGELGAEPTPDLYVAHLVEIFREVRRVLRDDGTVWLNLGDSANTRRVVRPSSHQGGLGFHNESIDSSWVENRLNGNTRMSINDGDLKEKDILGIPWMVAFALRADGWYLRSDIIWHKCLSGGAFVYARTQKGDAPTTIKDVTRLDPATVQLWDGEKWNQVVAWGDVLRNSDGGIEIEFNNGERIGCTREHRWPTQRGEVTADQLCIGDVVPVTRLPEPSPTLSPPGVPDELGWLIGTYLADGSTAKDGHLVQIASHREKHERFQRLKEIARHFGGSCAIHPTSANGCTVNIHSSVIGGIITEYISGNSAATKRLTRKAWQRSTAFLSAVLDGYLQGDGSRRADGSWRLGFTNNDGLAADLRTLGARLGLSVHLRRGTAVNTTTGKRHKMWHGDIRESSRRRIPDGAIVAIRASRARQFHNVSLASDPHTFALAGGLCTKNSNPMPESVQDRPTRSHEYLFLLSKKPRYFYDGEAIREPLAGSTLERYGKNDGTYERSSGGHTKYLTERDGGIKHIGQVGDSGLTPDGKRNKRSVWTLPTKSYKGAHFACVDAETEALTLDGWKRHDELGERAIIAAYDAVADRLVWELATFHRYEYDGELVAIEKRDTSQRLTPNHRCIVKHYKTGRITTVHADDLHPHDSMLMTASFSVSERDGIGEQWARLLGWYVTEGESRYSGSVRIYQSLSANKEHVAQIRSLLRNVGAAYKERTCTRDWRGRPSVEVIWSVFGAAAKRLQELAPGKALQPWHAFLPDDEATALLETLIDGDGHRRGDGRACIVQKDRGWLEAAQMLALRLGCRAHISRRQDGEYVLYLTWGKWLTLRGTNGVYKALPRIPYQGIVWCPSVPTTYWLARRNGKPFITGNTFPPALIEPCILAGTSAVGQCASSGKPYERVVEHTPMVIKRSDRRERMGEQGRTQPSGTMLSPASSTTVGWKPTCGAPYERVVEKGTPVLQAWSANGAGQYDLETGGMRRTSLAEGSTLKHTVPVETTGWRPTCGAPYERVVTSQFVPTQNPAFTKAGIKGMAQENNWGDVPRGRIDSETVGWRPTCACGADTIRPQVVLDPFSGSGTTGQVALQHGRRYVGIELNPNYIELSRERITKAMPPAP